MSLFNIFNVAGSAMSAQGQRLNVVSSNIANADSTTNNPNEHDPLSGHVGRFLRKRLKHHSSSTLHDAGSSQGLPNTANQPRAPSLTLASSAASACQAAPRSPAAELRGSSVSRVSVISSSNNLLRVSIVSSGSTRLSVCISLFNCAPRTKTTTEHTSHGNSSKRPEPSDTRQVSLLRPLPSEPGSTVRCRHL